MISHAKFRTRTGRFLIVAMVAGVAAAVLGPGPLPPAGAADRPGPISWLAAGDSYSSGEGLPHSTGACARPETGSRSQTWAGVAYSQLRALGSTVSSPELVACTGAVTSDLIDAKDGQGEPEWNPKMGRFDLVTFTFGGDNVGFGPVLEQCVGLAALVATVEHASTARFTHRNVAPLPSDPGHACPSESIIDGRISALAGVYRSFLTEVADQVVNPGGNIVVLGYPDLVETPRSWPLWERKIGSCWGIGISDAGELRVLAGDLNATIATAVAAINAKAPNHVHMTFVGVDTANGPTPGNDPNLFEPSSGVRHNLCSGDPWINGWSGLEWGSGSFHPKQQGLDAEGALVATFVSRLDWSHLAAPAREH